ncbi:MAG: NAD(P)-binding domain-containing protein [Gemmataceae bacterium]
MFATNRKVAILGAGPIGLEAALYARTLGFEAIIYEKGRVANHVQQWGHVRLFSPFEMNVTPLGIETIRQHEMDYSFPEKSQYTTGREHVTAYLEPLSRVALLEGTLRPFTEVLGISRRGFLKGEAVGSDERMHEPFRILVRTQDTERFEEADVVLDCTGTYSHPRYLGNGGLPALGELSARLHIRSHLEDILGADRETYAGKRTLVVGGGYSAATTIRSLVKLAAEAPNTTIVWLTRTKRALPLVRYPDDPLQERDALARGVNDLVSKPSSVLEYHNQCVIEEVKNDNQTFHVTVTTQKEIKSFTVDNVVANVGYTPNNELYRELQVHECYASLGPMKLAAAMLGAAGGDCLQQASHGADTLRNPEPNFYILGSKSYGRNSNFLLRVGFEQVRDVFRLMTDQPELDLYTQQTHSL